MQSGCGRQQKKAAVQQERERRICSVLKKGQFFGLVWCWAFCSDAFCPDVFCSGAERAKRRMTDTACAGERKADKERDVKRFDSKLRQVAPLILSMFFFVLEFRLCNFEKRRS